MSSVVKYNITGPDQLREMIYDVSNSPATREMKNAIIELGQNMISHSSGGRIYKNGVYVHAWHQLNNNTNVKNIVQKVMVANTSDPRELQGLGFYMMQQGGWKIKIKQKRNMLLISLSRLKRKNVTQH